MYDFRVTPPAFLVEFAWYYPFAFSFSVFLDFKCVSCEQCIIFKNHWAILGMEFKVDRFFSSTFHCLLASIFFSIEKRALSLIVDALKIKCFFPLGCL